MNVFLLYVVQSALCLSLFYGLYLLLLRREAFFRFNRSVLLAIMVSSMVIPLIRLPVANPALIQFPVMQIEEKISSFGFEVSRWAKPELEAPDPNMARGLGDNPETSATRTTFNVIPLAYLVGFLVSLVLVFVSFVSMARIIVTARPVMYRQQRIFVSPLQISPFTFAGWIVLSEMDYERFAAEIVTHENIHRRRGHFWDLCLVSVITVVHWFNPLVWLLRRELKALHEYEADRSAIAQGIDATRYQ
ncbi:MAG: M56 family metallopeptidase, partial [Bacteroidales bacterium]|nr:M56 family metallopeptidase [Bacteroidales bacterium]